MGTKSTEPELAALQVEIAKRLTCSSPTSDEVEIVGTSVEEMDQSRETLVRKRISQTKAWLPRTANLMGKEFSILFREFAASNHFNGNNAIAMDAIFFAKWLRSQEPDRPWIPELARWESLDCVWQTGSWFVRFYRFKYDFSDTTKSGTPPVRNRIWLCIRCNKWYRKLRI